MVDFSLWDILRNLLLAVRWTVLLSLIAFVGGGGVGLALLVARIAKLRGAEWLVAGYVQLFQGTPLLMQLFLAYFGLALFGIRIFAPEAVAAVNRASLGGDEQRPVRVFLQEIRRARGGMFLQRVGTITR